MNGLSPRQGLSEDPPSEDRLDSWKDIAAYVKRDVSTVQRWEKREGMPVYRHVHEKRGSVYAYRSELDTWWQRRAPRIERTEECPPGERTPERKSAVAHLLQVLSRQTRRTVAAISVAFACALAVLMVYLANGGHAAVQPARDIKSIAVLPLDNLSGDPAQDYLADGMTEELIGSLAKIRALRVVSRTSAMRFRESRQPLSEIARELGVDAVVEGSVQRREGRVKVRVQLVHGSTDTHLWASEYEGQWTDVLRLQGEVGRAVADEIRVQVTADERARMTPGTPIAPAAFQEYLLGRYHMSKQNEADIARAIGHFNEATRIEPKYAAAYAALSVGWWARGVWGAQTLSQVESATRAAAQQALALGPELAEAHVARGRIGYTYDRDWPGAEASFRRALETDPNNLDAHYFYAMLLMGLGRFAESIEHIERAAQLDPLSSMIQSGFGRVLYRARRYDEAIEHLHRAIALEPRNYSAYSRLGDVYDSAGRYAEALASYEQARSAGFGEHWHVVRRARVYARMGRTDQARRMLQDLKSGTGMPLVEGAKAYAALGDRDRAFELLFQAVDEPSLVIFVKEEPTFDRLHPDARWKALLARMNFAGAYSIAIRSMSKTSMPRGAPASPL